MIIATNARYDMNVAIAQVTEYRVPHVGPLGVKGLLCLIKIFGNLVYRQTDIIIKYRLMN